ncbi:hypothetical protein [Halosimplex sp. J119]
MTSKRTPLLRTAAVTGIAIVVGLVATALFPTVLRSPHGPPPEFLQVLVRVQLFVTTFNLVLLVALTGSYVSVYRELPNKYTQSLVVLSFSLVLYAVTSNPVTPMLFGFPPRPDLGPFVFIPDVFVGVAIVVLFYQSQT